MTSTHLHTLLVVGVACCERGYFHHSSASARELEEEDEELPPAPSVSLATLKSTLTLRQMIQMGGPMCIHTYIRTCVLCGGTSVLLCETFHMSPLQCETPLVSCLPHTMCYRLHPRVPWLEEGGYEQSDRPLLCCLPSSSREEGEGRRKEQGREGVLWMVVNNSLLAKSLHM